MRKSPAWCHRRRRGLTLIELSAGLAASAIVAVTAGVMLFYIVAAWRRDLALVNTQQDVTVAMFTLTRGIRGAAALDTALLPDMVQVTNALGVASRFYVDSTTRRLCEQRDIRDPTRVIRVTDLPVLSFTASRADDGVQLFLELQGSEGPLQNQAVVHLRN